MNIWLDSPPSLLDAAMVATTKPLWISYHQKKYSSKNNFHFPGGGFKTYSQVVNFVRTLENNVFPKNLKRGIVSTFIIMNWEFKFWSDQHDFLSRSTSWLPLLRWTAHGHIDSRETAKAIVKDDSFDYITRIRLACLHCLEEDICSITIDPILIEANIIKEVMLGRGKNPEWSFQKFNWHIYYLSVDSNPLEEVDLLGSYDSFAALEHFWPHLTKKQKSKLVVKIVYKRPAEYAKSFIFIMNKINEENLVILDEKIYFQILCKFMEVPYRRYFWELLERMMKTDSLTQKDYYDIFYRLQTHYMFGCYVLRVHVNPHLETWVKNYGQNFLHYFWNRIPQAYKVDFLGNLEQVGMMEKLFQERQYRDAMMECSNRNLRSFALGY